jgi:DNA polymerase I-like protein with 3'-5' exonuclease and polymerase domains
MIIQTKTYEAYQLLHNGVLALTRAEQAGIRVDIEYVNNKKVQLTHRIDHLEEQFKRTKFFLHWQHSMRGKVNINSNSQLSAFLYKIKKIKIEKETASGQGSTDDETLKQMNIPELNDLLQIRKLKKVRDTYLESFIREQVNGYIHPFFNLHLVQTFRSSSDHPNFQNIPKRDEESMNIVRRALYPRPGHQLLEIDYSGLEVRISACYHRDPTMLQYINNPKSDMHRDMTIQIFMLENFDMSLPELRTLRQAAKNGFVFPEFYGDYYKNCAYGMACGWGKLPPGRWKPGEGISIPSGTLSDHLISKGIKSLVSFENHIKKIEADFWGERFPDYADWKNRWYHVYKKYGYIDLLTGFRCGGVMDKKQVCNYPIQGAAFHCLLWSFIEIDKHLKALHMDTQLIGQIHDSMLLDVEPSELSTVVSLIRRITCQKLPEAWKWIIVPLDVDIEVCKVDDNWANKEKYKIIV